MPRKPSPKNLDNPLRILRVLCSEYGKDAPLTQVRMAELTGIAPDYIRSLENSRRPINTSQLDKIRSQIGAIWDRKRKMWMVNARPDEPFTYEWFILYRTFWFNSDEMADIETHMLCRRLQELLQGVEHSDYNYAFDRIYNTLEELRAELKVGAAKSLFEKTAYEIELLRSPKTDEISLVYRDFKRKDETVVANRRYLDLTPFSFTARRQGNTYVKVSPIRRSQPEKGDA